MGSAFEAVQPIFRHIWRDGDDVDSAEGFARLCERLGVADAEARISDPAVKEALRRSGEEALAAGVFGVPTLAIDGELFWGYDATDMALDYLRDPAAFISEEMRRVDRLPYGATRSVKER
jgi:2-hydroxychromene-2-carboxylate isomerase